MFFVLITKENTKNLFLFGLFGAPKTPHTLYVSNKDFVGGT